YCGNVELTAERVPQLLATAVLDPCKQLVCSEAKGHRREETECRRLFFPVIFCRMILRPALTASKVSKGRTSAPAAKTSILMRPSVTAPIVCASLSALG